jgi:hypothetical protein
VSRHTWSETGAKHVEGLDIDKKDGMTVMISSNGHGELLPALICVKGGTYQALEKFVKDDAEAWGMPLGMRSTQRKKWRAAVTTKLGCTDNISALPLHLCNLLLEIDRYACTCVFIGMCAVPILSVLHMAHDMYGMPSTSHQHHRVQSLRFIAAQITSSVLQKIT